MASVFVADDNPHVHRIVEETLQAEGHEVTGTLEGAGTLEAIIARKPDIVLLDSTMSGIDVYGTCRDALASPGMEKLRVVLLAGPLELIDNTQALTAGASAILQKPLDPGELTDLVSGRAKDTPEDATASEKPVAPGVDQLVHRALGESNSSEESEAGLLRDTIREQVAAVVTASMPAIIDRITDRLAEKLKAP